MAVASSIPAATETGKEPLPWLFSAPLDLAAFLGSALISLLLLLVGAQLGLLESETPEWTWIATVLLIDVAHVYATGFRVYFDAAELRRHPWLYGLTPVLSFLLGAALYSEQELWFWRALAYLAVFHFVRQQYGWVALYRARAGEQERIGRVIDNTAIYMATLYPLLYWHAHLPRKFWWFLDHDFATLPPILEQVIAPVYWMSLLAYFGRSIYRAIALGEFNPGKDIVVATTAVCWYAGIVVCNSDYAFTVTNVVIHGIPYLVLVYWYRQQHAPSERMRTPRSLRVATFLGTVWGLAFLEELFWDRGLWHERSWLFGSAWDLDTSRCFLVALLATPQITHYILDGFLWRRKNREHRHTGLAPRLHTTTPDRLR